MAQRIQTGRLGLTLAEIATKLNGRLEGDPNLWLERLTSAETADSDGLAFVEGASYVKLCKGKVGAVLAPEGLDVEGLPCIRVASPRTAFFELLNETYVAWPVDSGISPLAAIDPSAIIGDGVTVGAYAVIGPDAQLGDGAVVYSLAYVGARCVVGPGSRIAPHAVLMEDVHLGAGAIIHAGAVLGADGFGFTLVGGRRLKIPQVGRLEIGDDFEVGANTAIDRANAGATKIGANTKVDNLVQIGHNCVIGDSVVIAALTGIGGSTTIGDRATIAGLVAIGDHVEVVADVTVGGRSMVASDISAAGAYFGSPAVPFGEGRRNYLTAGRLWEMAKRLRELERQVAELQSKLNEETTN